MHKDLHSTSVQREQWGIRGIWEQENSQLTGIPWKVWPANQGTAAVTERSFATPAAGEWNGFAVKRARAGVVQPLWTLRTDQPGNYQLNCYHIPVLREYWWQDFIWEQASDRRDIVRIKNKGFLNQNEKVVKRKRVCHTMVIWPYNAEIAQLLKNEGQGREIKWKHVLKRLQ